MTDKKVNVNEEMSQETKEEVKVTTAENPADDDRGKEADGKEINESEALNEDADAVGEKTEAEETEEPKASEETESVEEWKEKNLRLMAEFQNYKKRVEKEKTNLYAYANEKIVTELLTVTDNFERALAQEAGEGFKEGMEMIFKQMTDVLAKSGLAEIEALGEDFDPNVHNAVMTEESEEYESGKVSGVMQKGYTLNGKVIRPAMVKVVN